MFILVTGSRNWTDMDLVRRTLEGHTDVTLIHGDCEGADKLCARAAQDFGFRVLAMPANWKKYGRAAGPIRNREMVEFFVANKGTLMYAFHDNLADSKGTKNCVGYAQSRGIKPIIISHRD
jgi:hypothetical protein